MTQAVIEDLPLALGQRSQIAVRAIGPQGSGAEAFPDGVTLPDVNAPELTVQVSPAAVVLGDEAAVTARALDPRGVRSLSVVVLDDVGAMAVDVGTVTAGGETSACRPSCRPAAPRGWRRAPT